MPHIFKVGNKKKVLTRVKARPECPAALSPKNSFQVDINLLISIWDFVI